VSGAAEGLLRAFGPGIVAAEVATRAWASAGAAGERHRLALRLSDEAADALLEGLAEREFALDRHIVADIAAVADERHGGEARLVIEALTVALD
jgi:hypothetical protein